jgi:putative transposase
LFIDIKGAFWYGLDMARKPRIEFEGALYHVITRGNQRQPIFRGKEDYERYLRILGDYKTRYEFNLYAYVLMGNHVHLLMETKEVPLSRILQGINQSYTMYFNRRYATVGHLFQGRYKAILCDRDSYLLSLMKYIHVNPIRAGVAKTLEVYPWSSHSSYVGQRRDKGIVDAELLLRIFSEDKRRARRAYLDYMGEAGILRREEVYATVDQRILGDEGFVEEVMGRTGRRDVPGRRRHAYKLTEIARATEEVCGITLAQLRKKGRGEGLGLGRRLMSRVAKEYGYKGQEIAGYLWRDPSVVTRYLKKGSKFAYEVEKVHAILRQYSNKKV